MSDRQREISPGVFAAGGETVSISGADLDFLRGRLASSPAGRVRLCAHRDPGEALHEMFILLHRDTYIRPHRHRDKAESLLVLEGDADAVFFDDRGGITAVLPLGAPGSGRDFYYRVDRPVYHTLLLRSEHFLYHEATTGPFRPAERSFAPWAPEEGDRDAARRYLADLSGRAAAFLHRETGNP